MKLAHIGRHFLNEGYTQVKDHSIALAFARDIAAQGKHVSDISYFVHSFEKKLGNGQKRVVGYVEMTVTPDGLSWGSNRHAYIIGANTSETSDGFVPGSLVGMDRKEFAKHVEADETIGQIFGLLLRSVWKARGTTPGARPVGV